MKVSFARQVKEEVVFNDFDICCQKAILSAIIKVNGTLSLSNQGLEQKMQRLHLKCIKCSKKFIIHTLNFLYLVK